MEQLINNMLANAQIPQIPTAVKKGESSSQKDGFQKLLEQKQGGDASQPAKAEKTETPDKPQDAQNPQKTQESGETRQPVPGPKNEKELEAQMALAAMAMLQTPVVPVEQVMTPEVQAEAAADEIVPLMAETVLTPEARNLAPETEAETLETPVEGNENQPVDQALAEELPQTIEAPEAARNTEGRTVEVKVETGPAEDGASGTEDGLTPQGAEVETPVEGNENQPVDQALAEELPQTIEAPEAARNTEGRTVEVKVETGPAEDGASGTEDGLTPQGAEVETPVFEDVKAVPVKVGEAHRAPQADEITEKQIAPKVNEALAAGQTRVELQLNPENLGKIAIEMTTGEDGKLVVVLHAENRDTQNLLSKDMSRLAELLGRESQQEVRVEVPRQEESQRQDLYEQQQEQQRQRQQEQRRRRETGGEDFLQQLRLGLIPMDGE